ncbi:MAG TPA: Fe-S cluster assembly protein SufD, partial [Gemmatimonadales bacterium]|nr:Fe-S cluster assembly protein SufD [Gemmatimonadales bacterium]
FPTPKDEDWKFTSVAAITGADFHPVAGTPDGGTVGRRAAGEGRNPPSLRPAVAEADLSPHLLAHPEWPRLVLLNGRVAPGLSRLDGLPAGVRLLPLSRALAEEPALVEGIFGTVCPAGENAFVAMNAAYAADGLVLVVSKGVELATPVHLLHVTDAAAEGAMIHARNLVLLERQAAATLVESFVSLADVPAFTNAVSEVRVGDGARLAHVKIQRQGERAFHVDTTQADQGRDSTWDSFSFAIGGALARTNLYTRLSGAGSHVTLDGLYILHGTQHVDHQTRVEHIAPNCTSWEVYKGILDGASHGVFNGKVYVRPEAQKTDGKQTNNNLVLSDRAKVDTKPQLEIFADDVKCTHGATVGRLDEGALFYLRSRGLPPAEARRTLTWGFASDVLQNVASVPVREHLLRLAKERLEEAAG